MDNNQKVNNDLFKNNQEKKIKPSSNETPTISLEMCRSLYKLIDEEDISISEDYTDDDEVI